MELDGVGRGSQWMGIESFGLRMEWQLEWHTSGIGLFVYLFVGMIYSSSFVSFFIFLPQLFWYGSRSR